MVGAMLQAGADPELQTLYLERVVQPRRSRLRAIFERAEEADLLGPDPDIDLAVASATGIYYSLSLAQETIGRDWSSRTAAYIWRALGGEPT